VSTLPNVISPYRSEACSKTGANCRQGPHQAAQKSTNTVTGAVLRQADVPALWRREPGSPTTAGATLHRLPDLPLGVLVLAP
jgi:hypothetical protein